MARKIVLEPSGVSVQLSGLVRLAATTARFAIPYDKIRKVETSPVRIPLGTLRLGGTAVPLTDIWEGHFRYRGKWSFFSFEDRNRTITLRLDGFTWHGRTYSTVVLGSNDPKKLQEQLVDRLTARAKA
jgi:hypothetical protein